MQLIGILALTLFAAPPAFDARAHLDRLTLPTAASALPLRRATPVLTIIGHDIFLDGVVVGSTLLLQKEGYWSLPSVERALILRRHETTDDVARIPDSPDALDFSADPATPYRVVKKVWAVANKVGYTDLDLAVRHPKTKEPARLESLKTMESRVVHRGERSVAISGIGMKGRASTQGLDPAVVDETVKKHRTALKDCYEKERAQRPDIAGKLVMRFVIAIDGSVSSAKVKSSTLKDGAVESCLEERFLEVRFPKPANGSFVTVNYPLLFEPTQE